MKSIRHLLTLAATSLILPGYLSAQTPASVEERLNALEQQVQGLTKENADLKKQLGWKEKTPPVIPQPAGKETKLVIGGFVQGQAEAGNASDPRWNNVNDRFFFRRARIYLAGSFAEHFDFKAELDLQGNTLGAATGQLARGNEIFVNWNKYPAANVRFGQVKPAYGAEALLSDTKMLTIERSLQSDRLSDSRQIGFAALGELSDKKISYYTVIGNGNGPNVSANDNNQFQYSARLAYTPVSTASDKVVLGVDGLWSNDAGLPKSDLGFSGNLFTGARDMAGLDATWTHGRFDFSGEWLHGVYKPANGIPAPELTAQGWQALAAYYVVPGKLQLVFRAEEFDPNADLGGNTIHTFTYGLNYYFKGDDIKFMLNCLDGHVPNSTTDGGRLLARVQLIF